MAELERPRGVIARVVRSFLGSRLSILLIVFSFALGFAALQLTAREEEPQIVVPLADVFIQAPGASAAEVEKLAATPLERLLWQIDGVEHVYSVSRPGQAVVTVRFFVGEDRERSLVKLYNRISMHMDEAPGIVRGWVVKPVEIDDVPILGITLYSQKYDDYALRRIAEEAMARLSTTPDTYRTYIKGGRNRVVRVALRPEAMAGYGVTALMVRRALAGADASLRAGAFDLADKRIDLGSQSFLHSAGEVAGLVVGVHRGRPVYLRDVAKITDGPQEAVHYSRLGLSLAEQKKRGQKPRLYSLPAVTIAVAKKRGTNAVDVAANVLARVDQLKGTVIPPGVKVLITRNYGRTAQDKSDELMSSLVFAVVTVVALLVFTMGWREALIVATSVPLSFALSLFVNLVIGYTINRVTMFALILSLGLVVDDPITNVDNIQRHIIEGKREPRAATEAGVAEVLPPVIMSTLAIIVSFAPMFFITGMMGPYMAPMAANVPLTVSFSMLFALTVVPWLAYHLLKHLGPKPGQEGGVVRDVVPAWVRRGYRSAVAPFMDHRALRWGLLLLLLALLGLSVALVMLRQVPVKMLPFDNKNEFQVVINAPAGTTLEHTDRVVRFYERFLARVPEVVDFTSYVGTSSPVDFNGLVRHYYLRQAPYQADIRVNLVPKDERAAQSHEIILRLRPRMEAMARRLGVKINLVEQPPGPPVVATLVAEVYGRPSDSYHDLIRGARHIEGLMKKQPLVVDIDDSTEAPRQRWDFVLDKEKAALHGVSTREVISTLRLALSGDTPATVHVQGERQPLSVRLILPRADRSSLVSLGRLTVAGAGGSVVQLGELGRFTKRPVDQPIYHKDLKRVVYTYAELAGRSPATTVMDLESALKKDPMAPGLSVDWAGEGEWQITLRVFRDLGLAFAAALVGIYMLLVIQTGSFLMPLIIMLAIPLTLIGIMPGFWILNMVAGGVILGQPNPVFFTATSMIGMIALGGIVIRNSVVLIEFVQNKLEEGGDLRQAILDSGAVRFRPIVLTAATTALGVWPITLDPIFSGLAWALIFGLFASTAFTLIVVPVTYYSFFRKKRV